MKFYCYRHIRLDTNVPFYIGIGRKNNKKKRFTSTKNEYMRAYKSYGRSEYWENITNKTNYEVEIIFESNSEEEIKNKELEFIKLYGRRDLGLGTLVNMTDGGEGVINWSFEAKKKMSDRRKNSTPWNKGLTKETDERVKKYSDSLKGQIKPPVSEETKRKSIQSRIGQKRDIYKLKEYKILNTSSKEIFNSLEEAAIFLQTGTQYLLRKLKGTIKNNSNLEMLDEYFVERKRRTVKSFKKQNKEIVIIKNFT